MAGAPQVVGGVLAAARDRRLGRMVVGEELRPLFGDYWAQIERELPSPDGIRDIETFVAAAGKPQAYDVDDLVLLGRDGERGLYSFSFNLDNHDGQVVLDARPLIRVSRVGTLPAD
jgi:hypothetical protein